MAKVRDLVSLLDIRFICTYILYVHMNNNTVLLTSEYKKLFHGVEGCKVSALHAKGIRNCITLYNSV